MDLSGANWNIKDKQKNILKIILIFLSSIILAIILSPLGKIIDSNILGIYCSAAIFGIVFEAFKWQCYLQGFVYFYIFWLSFFSFYLLKKGMAWLFFIIGTFFFWLLYITYIATSVFSFHDIEKENVSNLFTMLVFLLLGYILALGIRRIKDKGQRNNEPKAEN